MNRTGERDRRYGTTAASASAINHKSLFYEYSELAAKITSVAEDRSAFPSFLRPYAVVLSSPYANSPACNTPAILLVRASILPLRMRARVWFSMVVNANEWAVRCRGVFLSFIHPFCGKVPATLKRSEEKWWVTISSLSRDPPNSSEKPSKVHSTKE